MRLWSYAEKCGVNRTLLLGNIEGGMFANFRMYRIRIISAAVPLRSGVPAWLPFMPVMTTRYEEVRRMFASSTVY